MPNPIYLVSACLAGQKCRYDGRANTHPLCQALVQQGLAVPICPECDGGLPIPRDPAERQGDLVVTCRGRDVTQDYHRGALAPLRPPNAWASQEPSSRLRAPPVGVA